MKNIVVEFILYVADQKRSRDFYIKLLELEPVLDVPGITEFQLSFSCKLGLMAESSISKIISSKVPHPSEGNGIPRCELYLYVDNVTNYYKKALALKAILISSIEKRDWGDKVCYFSDPDGHIIAFAQKMPIKK